MPVQKITRQELIAKCLEVFKVKGYNATSMQDLAVACGLTKGIFYHYYTTKDDLIIAALESVHAYFNHVFFKRMKDSNLSFEDKKVIFREKAIQLFDVDGGCVMGNAALEVVNKSEEYSTLLRTFFEEWINAMSIMFQQNGWSETKSQQAAIAAVAQIEGTIMMMRVFKDREILENMLDKLLE